MPLASKLAPVFLVRLCSYAWHEGLLVTFIGQFEHGAFALTQLFGHRKQLWLVQQQPQPRALTLSSAALAVAVT